jgi:hypothetical protein
MRCFKNLLSGFATAALQQRRGVTGTRQIHGLSEIALGVIVFSFATPNVLQISAVCDPRADVQIGGGVRVGDAFQAMLDGKTHSSMGTVDLCLKFSSGARGFRAPATREIGTSRRA